MGMFRWAIVSTLILAVAGVAGACGGTDPSLFGGVTDGGVGDQTVPPPNADACFLQCGDGTTGGDATALAITPLDAVVDVTVGQPAPKVSYTAFLGGQAVGAGWSIDRGEIGAIGVATGVFVPTGGLGGKATVTASFNGKTASTSVTVRLHMIQNGDPNSGDAGGGAGGNGGVGGEGPGAAISKATQQILQGPTTSDPALGWLYPYDKTVWPRGVLAPLLQWSAGTHDFDAVYIHIVEASFEYLGFFAKTATPFTHHPIPQAAWKAMAYSNGGENVTVSLVFSEGANAYGALSETWKVARGTLKGTVYYNSYGTNLAHNYCCTATNQRFGGATLAIKGGSTDPVLVAGNDTDCRVCHSVSADGSKLVTQHGDQYAASSVYDLKNANTETFLSPADSRFAFPALAPDGSYLFSNSAPVPGTGNTSPSDLFAIPSGAPIPGAGLPAGLRAGCPAFSPDGKHVAFNYYAGPAGDQKTLAALDFAQPTNTFANLTTLYTPPSGRAVWPSFLPTNDAVVFELETVSNGEFAATRTGSRGELWWVDQKTQTATRLDRANGLGYAPVGANGHADDTTLQYEPTINPVASGGYAWVVFTSRRMYGNVATIDPYWSDPRYNDISVTPTTKKLWVAAIDLGATPGSDPSHPAFYLPAQELLAGNSRGYWVVDPCHVDGTACETGDECCGGFCRPGPDGGGLMCTAQTPGCAQEFEKCTTSADCCGVNQGITCINGRCAQPTPK